jgi:choline dehydrogenase-like flavoprotein
MFIDSRTLDTGHSADVDICIIGAGAAGITLALELEGIKSRVCILESGGLVYDVPTQALYKGEVIGFDYDPLDVARLRYFGGTTNHWAGWCRRLEEQDFLPRAWINNSGWPIQCSVLDSYYERAERICQVSGAGYESDYWRARDAELNLIESKHLRTRNFAHSAPTRFGVEYRARLEQAENVDTYLFANVIDIVTDPDGRHIRAVECGTLEGKRFKINAKIVVLAAGGIENPRLLLISNRTHKNGLGNANDLVGRYFADHYGVEIGTFLLNDPAVSLDFYKYHKVQPEQNRPGYPITGCLSFTPEFLHDNELPHFCLILYAEGWGNVLPFGGSMDRLLEGNFAEFADDIGTIMSNLDDAVIAKYQSVFDEPAKRDIVRSIAIFEPEPNPESRVLLSSERDQLGMPRVKLDWRISERERRQIIRTRKLVAQEFGSAQLGRMMLDIDEDEWPPRWFDIGRHHMGTTRMHNDPKQGVVDADCRMHGISNLYIAGSSVFPAFGFAQPTLTITALAVRLADHIKREL